MSKKQTSVTVDIDNALLNETPYKVSVAGQVDASVIAKKTLNPNTGKVTVSVRIPTVVEGLTESPKYSDSTLDAIARRIAPGAKIFAKSALEFNRYMRVYTTN